MTSGRRPRRSLVLLALVLAIALVIGGVLVWRSFRSDDAYMNAIIGTPKDLLVAFTLDRSPVPGWRLSTVDIGLPEGVSPGDLFASTADRAYFVADDADGEVETASAYVYGIDLASGSPLFAPIVLQGFTGGPSSACYSNGPTEAVCVSKDSDGVHPQTIWILDLESGRVKFTGATELHVTGGAPSGAENGGVGKQGLELYAVGNFRGETRVIVLREGEGVYGFGADGKRTWFVAGGGDIFNPGYSKPSDIPAPTIAMQNPTPDRLDAPYRVFTVDGLDLTPSPPDGTRVRKALVYNGGFAYSYHEPGERDGLLFYDDAGRFVARYQNPNADLTPVENSVMPMARLRSDPPQWLVLSAAGDLVQSIPAENPASSFRFIGDYLFVELSGGDGEERWQRWNLTGGEPGPICPMQLEYSYIGSDGNIVLVGGGAISSTVRAVDPASCATIWEIDEAEAGAQLAVWKVGTGLLQRTSDALTQLMSGP